MTNQNSKIKQNSKRRKSAVLFAFYITFGVPTKWVV
jgi:hypothetical protein